MLTSRTRSFCRLSNGAMNWREIPGSNLPENVSVGGNVTLSAAQSGIGRRSGVHWIRAHSCSRSTTGMIDCFLCCGFQTFGNHALHLDAFVAQGLAE